MSGSIGNQKFRHYFTMLITGLPGHIKIDRGVAMWDVNFETSRKKINVWNWFSKTQARTAQDMSAFYRPQAFSSSTL
jgi:hypothetical protein